MNHIKSLILLACFTFLAGALYAAPQPTLSTTYLGYNPQTGQNDLTQTIVYQFPDPNRFGYGPFPLFTWIPGSYENFRDTISSTFVSQMAARGFVGASVQYNNSYIMQTCSEYQKRAQAIYEATRSTSAITVLCSISGVSCGNGVVAAGTSQGAAISIMAKNYAPSVQAVFAMSISDYNQNGVGVNLAGCLDKPTTAILANRLMIVNGQNDSYFGGQTPLQNVSGYTCPAGSTQCWSTDGSGSGWYLVQNTQVNDSNADHCYELVGDCSYSQFDPNWFLPATNNWSLKPNLDWLATLGTRRVFSANGL